MGRRIETKTSVESCKWIIAPQIPTGSILFFQRFFFELHFIDRGFDSTSHRVYCIRFVRYLKVNAGYVVCIIFLSNLKSRFEWRDCFMFCVDVLVCLGFEK